MPNDQKRPRQHLDDPADEFIEGAGAIAKALFGEDTPTRRKRVFYLHEQKLVPIGKLGGKLIASKSKLRRHIDFLTSGKA